MNHNRLKFHQIFSTLCWTFYQIFNPGKDIRTKDLHGGQFWKLIQVPPSLLYSSLGQGPLLKQPPSQSLHYTYCYHVFQKAHEFCQKKFVPWCCQSSSSPGKVEPVKRSWRRRTSKKRKNFEHSEALGVSWREESSRRAALQMIQRSDYYSCCCWNWNAPREVNPMMHDVEITVECLSYNCEVEVARLH